MEEEKIVLDRKSFEALAVDTRVKILKSLKERRKTLSEIAKEQNMSVSGVKEHLETLEKVELIKKIDDGHKWKYYELSKKGSDIVGPREIRVWILLSISTVALIASFIAILSVSGPATALVPDGVDHTNYANGSAPSNFLTFSNIMGGAVPENATNKQTGNEDGDGVGKERSDVTCADTESEMVIGGGQYNFTNKTSNDSGSTSETNRSDVPDTNNSSTSNNSKANANDSQWKCGTTGYEHGKNLMPENRTEQDIGADAKTDVKPGTFVPVLVGTISGATMLACIGILIKNRLKPSGSIFKL
jgi:DNA-binding transcriptional ArsR family regulator